MSSKRRKELNIKQLPSSLLEATESLENDREFLKPIFNDEVIDRIIDHGVKEYREVTLRPHPHEFALYADI